MTCSSKATQGSYLRKYEIIYIARRVWPKLNLDWFADQSRYSLSIVIAPQTSCVTLNRATCPFALPLRMAQRGSLLVFCYRELKQKSTSANLSWDGRVCQYFYRVNRFFNIYVIAYIYMEGHWSIYPWLSPYNFSLNTFHVLHYIFSLIISTEKPTIAILVPFCHIALLYIFTYWSVIKQLFNTTKWHLGGI